MSRRLPRTVVVGLDGAAPALLFPWARSGHLPVLGSLLRRSLHGELRSTLPPMTLPAWSSFLTGRTPGEHGIFDFTWPEVAARRVHLVDARDRIVPTIPRLLSDRGYRVGTFLFPTTWPPEPLSGGQVSGFDSPVAVRVTPSACNPRSLHSDIGRAVDGEVRFSDFPEFRKRPGWQERAVRSLLDGIEAKEKMAVSLLRDGPPFDLFAVLFGESDTAAHHFWHLHDPGSPRHDPEAAALYGDVLLRVYQRLDAALGAILKAAPWAESVVVASDHGFGGSSRKALHLNAFLAETGFLHFRNSSPSRLARRTRSYVASMTPPALLDRLYRRMPRGLFESLEWSARYGQIDMSCSLAWSEELNYAPSLRLNPLASAGGGSLRGELLDSLERVLLDWRDPSDGAAVVRAVHRREDLYPGPCVERAPELFLELATPGGYSFNVLPSRPGQLPLRELRGIELDGAKGAGMPGSHRRAGIFLLQAPGLAPGRRKLEIADLLPLWLECSGLSDLLQEGDSVPPPSLVAGRRAARSEEPGSLTRRLRRLGYL